MDLRTAKTLSPQEYHARRTAARSGVREDRRLRKLLQVREAVQRLAPRYPAVRCVYLFGSLMRPGRFHAASDIDVAVVCDDLEVETPFARALERELETTIDLRPFKGAIIEAVRDSGEQVYG